MNCNINNMYNMIVGYMVSAITCTIIIATMYKLTR